MDSIDSFAWSDAVKRAIVNGDVTGTGVEVLRMGAGFRAMPVDEGKNPFGWLTPHGVTDATDDPIVIEQWMAVAGDAGIAIGLAASLRFWTMTRERSTSLRMGSRAHLQSVLGAERTIGHTCRRIATFARRAFLMAAATS
jgi:hypothetical protein